MQSKEFEQGYTAALADAGGMFAKLADLDQIKIKTAIAKARGARERGDHEAEIEANTELHTAMMDKSGNLNALLAIMAVESARRNLPGVRAGQ
jgi:DNA-binding GntR family transcriptional regulator